MFRAVLNGKELRIVIVGGQTFYGPNALCVVQPTHRNIEGAVACNTTVQGLSGNDWKFNFCRAEILEFAKSRSGRFQELSRKEKYVSESRFVFV